jgi:Acetyltransferase (GNAT) family
LVQISELDVQDDAALHAYWEVEPAAQRADRSDPLPRPFSQLEQIVRRPAPYNRQTLVVAKEDDRIIGVGGLAPSLRENLHLAEVEVGVLPEERRRGTAAGSLRPR